MTLAPEKQPRHRSQLPRDLQTRRQPPMSGHERRTCLGKRNGRFARDPEMTTGSASPHRAPLMTEKAPNPNRNPEGLLGICEP